MRTYRYSKWFTIAAGLAFLTGCESTPPAADAGEGLAVGQTLEEDDEDRLICKRQRVVGSHVPRTVCKTEAQLAAEREAMERSVGTRRPMTGYNSQRDPGSDPPR